MHSKDNGWFGPVRDNFVYEHVLIRIHQQFLAYFILHFPPLGFCAGVRGVIVNKQLEQSMLFIVHRHPY